MAVTRTNSFALLTILIRAIAVFFIFGLLVQSMSLLEAWVAGDSATDALFRLQPWAALVSLVAAVLAWLFADVIARLALARRDAPIFESDLTPAQWQSIIFAALGVIFVMDGLVKIAKAVAVWMAASSVEDDVYSRWADWSIWLIASDIAQVILGLILLLGARGLANLVHRLRNYSPKSYGSQSSEQRSE